MKIVYNNLIPFPGYCATILFGAIFARKKYKPLSRIVVNHEKIHHAQAKEVGGYLLFYLKYLIWWIRRGYRNAPFEREAYTNAANLDYLKNREPHAWKKYK